MLITINKEDYGRAKQKFHAKETKYIPGVGVNIDRFELGQEEREQNRKLKREELAVPEKDLYCFLWENCRIERISELL